jgi:hypothetical protein
MSEFRVTEADRVERNGSVRDVLYVQDSGELDVYFNHQVRRDMFTEALQGCSMLYVNFDRNAVTFGVSGDDD